MNRPERRRRILRMLPGLILGGAAIVALVWIVDWRQTADAWRRANLWVMFPAFAITIAAMLTRALAWRSLMGDAVPLRDCFWMLNISYLMNNILPFRLGDVARAFLVSGEKDSAPAVPARIAAGTSPPQRSEKEIPGRISVGTAPPQRSEKEIPGRISVGTAPPQRSEKEIPGRISVGTAPPQRSEKEIPSRISVGTAPPQRSEKEIPSRISVGTALSAVALERMFDLTFTLIFVISIFPLIAGVEMGARVLLSAFGLALAFFTALLLAGALSPQILRIAETVVGRLPFLRPVLSPLGYFLDGLKRVRDIRCSLPAFIWIGITMLLWAAEYWVVMSGFFADVPLYWGLLSLVGGLIGAALPSPPGSVGVYEAVVVLVLGMSGLAREAIVAFTIAIHVFNIVVLSGLGALGLLIERQSLGGILARSQSAAPGDGRPAA
jgi:uncharacterized membrane protein YbhN (UPF0104 family)